MKIMQKEEKMNKKDEVEKHIMCKDYHCINSNGVAYVEVNTQSICDGLLFSLKEGQSVARTK